MPPVRDLALASFFATVDDPRIERTKAHNLLDSIIITMCAVICGADDWVGVAEFGTSKQAWLQQCSTGRRDDRVECRMQKAASSARRAHRRRRRRACSPRSMN
jgi:hypothetical protein